MGPSSLASSSGVKVGSDKGKRIGPVFSSVEKAQDSYGAEVPFHNLVIEVLIIKIP